MRAFSQRSLLVARGACDLFGRSLQTGLQCRSFVPTRALLVAECGHLSSWGGLKRGGVCLIGANRSHLLAGCSNFRLERLHLLVWLDRRRRYGKARLG